MSFLKILLLLPPLFLPSLVRADDLILLEKGRSSYQIVVPDRSATPGLEADLAETARLLQTAFEANGATVPVVPESERRADQPALLLGDTALARAQGIVVERLRDWSYVHRVVGRDIVIAGHDHPSHAASDNPRRPNWDRTGSTKAAVDFAREFLGVRFLFPELRGYQPPRHAESVDLLHSPCLEFLPLETIRVPADLNREKHPLLHLNTAHPEGGSFYDLAHNRFPRVDRRFGSHTWGRAVPPELYSEHPEYFALVNGVRLEPKEGHKGGQYCLSHPEVQERIYRDVASHFDRGFNSVDLGQPDGFQACQCEACDALYDTGKDWSEKIWIFHRKVAERLERSHPGKEVTMMSYILTAAPPKSFTAFPSNTGIMLTGTNEEDIAAWEGIEVPRGFTGYVYNWCPNLGTRYTPMRTPGFIERQVKRLAAADIRALLRDGPGQLFGLEGPVYYTMGRMFDDPGQLDARTLVEEYCEAAFPQANVRFHMKSFYDELYHAIAPYSDHFGTRSPGWSYRLYPTDARTRKSVTDPFPLITFLYSPRVLADLETSLGRAEALADQPKIRERLALIRSEFDYIKHFAGVAHLHQAWQVAPDASAMDRLLDAIDARNAYIEGLFVKSETSGWRRRYFPLPGHNADHLRLASDGYQEPYAGTCYNWDTARLRKTPATGPKRLKVGRAPAGPVTLDAAIWREAPVHGMSLVPPLHGLPRESRLQLLWDDTALHLRFELELGANTSFSAVKADRDPDNQQAVEIHLQPDPAHPLQYRFAQWPEASSGYDAIRGAISDVMDPRHGRYDSSWNGEWTREVRVEARENRWLCRIRIPFATLGTKTPVAGMSWKANFGRNSPLSRGRMDRAVWSSPRNGGPIGEPDGMGEIEFE